MPFKKWRKVAAAVGLGIRPTAESLDADTLLLDGGTGAAGASSTDGSAWFRSDGDSTNSLELRISSSWEAIQTAAALSASTGAALIGIADAAASLAATTVEAALAELATPMTLAAAAEATNVIAVTVTATGHVAQYVARVYDANMLLETVANFSCAETGDGAEVSTTGKTSLLFTTAADGDAVISVTDVMGASGATVYLEVSPLGASAGAGPGKGSIIAITFD